MEVAILHKFGRLMALVDTFKYPEGERLSPWEQENKVLELKKDNDQLTFKTEAKNSIVTEYTLEKRNGFYWEGTFKNNRTDEGDCACFVFE